MNLFNSKIIIILLIFPFFKPAYFSSIPATDNLYNICRLLSALISVAIFIYYKGKISEFLLMVILYRLVILIPTYMNDGDYETWFNRTAMVLVVCFIIERSIMNNVEKTLGALSILLTTLITINLLTWSPDGLFLNPDTGISSLFLGIRTRLSDSIFPALAVSILYSYYTKKRITFSTVFLFVVSYTTFLIESVATGLLGINMLIIFLFLYRSKLAHVFNIKVLAIIALALNILVVFFRVQNLFSFIIVDLLNKNLTLTGRTNIWDAAIEYIKSSLVLGYGEVINGAFAPFGWQLWQGHSQIIQLLHDGGLIGLFIFLLMNYFVIKELVKYKKTRYSTVLSTTLFVIFVMMISEIYGYYPYYYVLLTIGANVGKVIAQDKMIKVNSS